MFGVHMAMILDMAIYGKLAASKRGMFRFHNGVYESFEYRWRGSEISHSVVWVMAWK